MKITLFVPGIPIPKQSFVKTPNGGYTPAQVAAWESSVRIMTGSAMRLAGCEPTRGPVAVRVEFFLPDRRRRDIDNLEKAILDGLKGEAFADDDQVIDLAARKVYLEDLPKGEQAGAWISAWEIGK